MTTLYPARYDIEKLSQNAIALKIARHSRCSECDSCGGLHPPPDAVLEPDSAEFSEDFLSSDDDERDSRYLAVCACGHGTLSHGADEARLGRSEYVRRARVAIRLDELLMVSSVTCIWNFASCLTRYYTYRCAVFASV